MIPASAPVHAKKYKVIPQPSQQQLPTDTAAFAAFSTPSSPHDLAATTQDGAITPQLQLSPHPVSGFGGTTGTATSATAAATAVSSSNAALQRPRSADEQHHRLSGFIREGSSAAHPSLAASDQPSTSGGGGGLQRQISLSPSAMALSTHSVHQHHSAETQTAQVEAAERAAATAREERDAALSEYGALRVEFLSLEERHREAVTAIEAVADDFSALQARYKKKKAEHRDEVAALKAQLQRQAEKAAVARRVEGAIFRNFVAARNLCTSAAGLQPLTDETFHSMQNSHPLVVCDALFKVIIHLSSSVVSKAQAEQFLRDVVAARHYALASGALSPALALAKTVAVTTPTLAQLAASANKTAGTSQQQNASSTSNSPRRRDPNTATSNGSSLVASRRSTTVTLPPDEAALEEEDADPLGATMTPIPTFSQAVVTFVVASGLLADPGLDGPVVPGGIPTGGGIMNTHHTTAGSRQAAATSTSATSFGVFSPQSSGGGGTVGGGQRRRSRRSVIIAQRRESSALAANDDDKHYSSGGGTDEGGAVSRVGGIYNSPFYRFGIGDGQHERLANRLLVEVDRLEAALKDVRARHTVEIAQIIETYTNKSASSTQQELATLRLELRTAKGQLAEAKDALKHVQRSVADYAQLERESNEANERLSSLKAVMELKEEELERIRKGTMDTSADMRGQLRSLALRASNAGIIAEENKRLSSELKQAREELRRLNPKSSAETLDRAKAMTKTKTDQLAVAEETLHDYSVRMRALQDLNERLSIEYNAIFRAHLEASKRERRVAEIDLDRQSQQYIMGDRSPIVAEHYLGKYQTAMEELHRAQRRLNHLLMVAHHDRCGTEQRISHLEDDLAAEKRARWIAETGQNRSDDVDGAYYPRAHYDASNGDASRALQEASREHEMEHSYSVSHFLSSVEEEDGEDALSPIPVFAPTRGAFENFDGEMKEEEGDPVLAAKRSSRQRSNRAATFAAGDQEGESPFTPGSEKANSRRATTTTSHRKSQSQDTRRAPSVSSPGGVLAEAVESVTVSEKTRKVQLEGRGGAGHRRASVGGPFTTEQLPHYNTDRDAAEINTRLRRTFGEMGYAGGSDAAHTHQGLDGHAKSQATHSRARQEALATRFVSRDTQREKAVELDRVVLGALIATEQMREDRGRGGGGVGAGAGHENDNNGARGGGGDDGHPLAYEVSLRSVPTKATATGASLLASVASEQNRHLLLKRSAQQQEQQSSGKDDARDQHRPSSAMGQSIMGDSITDLSASLHSSTRGGSRRPTRRAVTPKFRLADTGSRLTTSTGGGAEVSTSTSVSVVSSPASGARAVGGGPPRPQSAAAATSATRAGRVGK